MQRAIWYIFAVTFGLGLLMAFGVKRHFNPIGIQVRALSGNQSVVDSLGIVDHCTIYELAPDTSFTAIEKNVKWRIGENTWKVQNPIVEEIMFTQKGKIPIELYVDGKLRGVRSVVVEDCAGALVYIPDNIRQGDTHQFLDKTKGSISRRWFIQNSVSSSYKEYDDQGGELNFEFDYSGPYLIKTEVSTEDTTYILVKKVQVGERFKEKKAVKPFVKSDPVAIKEHKKEQQAIEELAVIEEVKQDEIEEQEVLTEPVTEVTGSKTDYFGNRMMVDDTWKVEQSTWYYGADENCLSFNGDKRTLFLRNLKADLCLTNLYFVPNLDITGNKVRISIENTKDVDGKFKSKPIVRTLSRSNSGSLSTVNVKSIACYLKKGESYKIIVDPEPDSEVGEVDKSDYSCIEGMEGFKHAEVQVQSKTKILKIEYKVRE